MDRLLEYISHHPWLAAFAVAAAMAVLINELRQRALGFAALGPQDVIRLMNQGATLLDMRAQQEYQQGHISGARHFEPGQLATASDTLKRYKEKALIVYCDRGASAGAAVRALTKQGFTKVFNLRGGIAAWRAENLPLARD
ncbi:MAG TPA: rhodanese-like domain-containing protein [Steroidobacteraceae bacterium]|jgi:rhodanese-related sulfurtransferase|nr:rhodanese-like domain-containing protein [Steroidobacteraceae bacterium]